MLVSKIFSAANRRLFEQTHRLCITSGTAGRDWSSTAEENIKKEKPGEEKVGWSTIYKFPYIGIVSALNRTKWYQLGATVLGCPFAYALEMSGEVGAGTALICAAVGLSATIATTGFSRLSNGTVGFFYSNQDDSKVRFGYVDANGKRQDVIANADSIQSKGENRYFMRIVVPGDTTKTPLKLFHSHGIILDVGKFNSLL